MNTLLGKRIDITSTTKEWEGLTPTSRHRSLPLFKGRCKNTLLPMVGGDLHMFWFI